MTNYDFSTPPQTNLRFSSIFRLFVLGVWYQLECKIMLQLKLCIQNKHLRIRNQAALNLEESLTHLHTTMFGYVVLICIYLIHGLDFIKRLISTFTIHNKCFLFWFSEIYPYHGSKQNNILPDTAASDPLCNLKMV